MPRTNGLLILSASAMLTVAGIAWAQGGRPARGDAALIRSATSAAPAAISREATVVAMGADGSMRTLRRGRNGFTCMADNPVTPGPDPMCMDPNSMDWAMAWISHRPPPRDRVGLMYMLAGGTDASNIDPYAEQPGRAGGWIRTGPHLMVVGSESLLSAYPAGPNPDTSKPYVMWPGTSYAHLMIPVR